MHPKVEEYLAAQAEKERAARQEELKKQAEKEEAARREEKAKRDRILIRCGLYTTERKEVTRDDFYDSVEKIDGVKHYYRNDVRVAIEVTDEEYEQILKTLPEHAADKPQEKSMDATSSGAATFFYVVALIIWVAGGLASFIIAAVIESFSMFLIYAASAFFAGAVCMCASELFKKLTEILKELKAINGKI